MALKFTWRGFLRLVQKIVPVLLGVTEANAAPAKPKTGLFTVATTVVTPLIQLPAKVPAMPLAHTVPGAVAAGVPANVPVSVASGLKVSWTQVGVVLLQIIVFARYVGMVTHQFTIPAGLEDLVTTALGHAQALWQTIMAIVALFTVYRLREAMPPKVVVADLDE